MSEILTIVARIEAKVDKVELVKAEVLKLVVPTLKEVGCIQYDLHQDTDNPAVFWFVEQWESPVHLKQHAKNTHIAAYRKATEGAIEASEVNKMVKIS
jgi:quinol monooxygenase YgiN